MEDFTGLFLTLFLLSFFLCLNFYGSSPFSHASKTHQAFSIYEQSIRFGVGVEKSDDGRMSRRIGGWWGNTRAEGTQRIGENGRRIEEDSCIEDLVHAWVRDRIG